MAEAQHPPASRECGSSLRPTLVFFVFLLAGPPLGLLTLLAGGVVADMYSSGRVPRMAAAPELLAKTYLAFVLMSYLFGGLQAMMVGAVASISQMTNPKALLRLKPVLIASVGVAVLYLAYIALKRGIAVAFESVSITLLVYVGAAILCWMLVNALLWLGGKLQRARIFASNSSVSPE